MNPVAGCTDGGTGTETAPFRTPQAAVDVVEPGQVVRLDGDVTATVSITRSGTPTRRSFSREPR